MTLGVPDPIARKITGHRSRELERYQHLTPEVRALTVNLIATELFRARRGRTETGTPTGTVEDVARVERLLAFALLDKKPITANRDGSTQPDLRLARRRSVDFLMTGSV